MATLFLQYPHIELILTPNARLSRYCRRDFEQSLTTASRPTPAIMPLQSYLIQLYQQSTKQPRRLLNPEQERLIWQQVIQQSAVADLISDQPITDLIQQAWQFSQQWQLEHLSDFANVDQNHSQQWFKAFNHYCDEQQLITQAELPGVLLQQAEQLSKHLPKQILRYHFDDSTPALDALYASWREIGVEIIDINGEANPNPGQQVVFADLAQEITAMVNWAKQTHAEHPDITILCIIPNLAQLRPQLIREFRASFFPEQQFNSEFKQSIYNISGGYPLSQAPIIEMALLLLRLSTQTISFNELSQLLRSPFITGYEQELPERLNLETTLRERNLLQLNQKYLTKLVQKQQCIVLTEAIESLTELNQRLSLADWQAHLLERLTRFGWPGDRDLTSEEFQQVQRFYDLLNSLPTLEVEPKLYRYSQVIKLLAEQCQRTLFAPESHDGPVQVLGLLEAAGLTADYMWMLHVDADTWPAAAKPNPFIDYQLQRDRQLPHSSAERERQFAEQFTTALLRHNQHCLFSYHQQADNSSINPSPLLANMPIIELPIATEMIFKPTELEVVDDQQGPALPSEYTPGGSGVFKSQATCPFQAFARYRLQAYGLTEPAYGLDALDRGIVVHRCLDLFWRQVHDRDQLNALTTAQLETQVAAIIDDAFVQLLRYQLKPVYASLAKQTIKALLLRWLDLEKQRPYFKVLSTEQQQQFNLNGLLVNLQMDRIDQLADEQLLVIDYKTGQPKANAWLGEHLREPQLPLYCLTDTHINAIAFGQLHPSSVEFIGVSATDNEIDGIKSISDYKTEHDDWASLRANWQSTLSDLAEDYKQGWAAVTPIDHTVCQYCELHSLCRINELECLAND